MAHIIIFFYFESCNVYTQIAYRTEAEPRGTHRDFVYQITYLHRIWLENQFYAWILIRLSPRTSSYKRPLRSTDRQKYTLTLTSQKKCAHTTSAKRSTGLSQPYYTTVSNSKARPSPLYTSRQVLSPLSPAWISKFRGVSIRVTPIYKSISRFPVVLPWAPTPCASAKSPADYASAFFFWKHTAEVSARAAAAIICCASARFWSDLAWRYRRAWFSLPGGEVCSVIGGSFLCTYNMHVNAWITNEVYVYMYGISARVMRMYEWTNSEGVVVWVGHYARAADFFFIWSAALWI